MRGPSRAAPFEGVQETLDATSFQRRLVLARQQGTLNLCDASLHYIPEVSSSRHGTAKRPATGLKWTTWDTFIPARLPDYLPTLTPSKLILTYLPASPPPYLSHRVRVLFH